MIDFLIVEFNNFAEIKYITDYVFVCLSRLYGTVFIPASFYNCNKTY